MSRLELAVPPLALTVVLALCMAGLAFATPDLALDLGRMGSLMGAVVMAAGIAVCVAGVVAFRRARTTVDPTRPGDASVVVDGGVYAFTRNPMYLGFFLFLVGVGLALGHWLSVVLAIAFVPYMNRFQIAPEETMLRDKFGPAYAAYASRVRRWI